MVDLQGQAVVAILTRAPSSGGKSRLFAALGRPVDPDLLAALFLDTLDAAAVPGVRRVVCYTPADSEAEVRSLVGGDVPLMPQRGTDLGARMRHAFEDLFAARAAAVVLIGSDLPSLESSVIEEAHRLLRERHDIVVLGPATDGGYYLIGATRPPLALFDGIAWGGADVLDRTERRARDAGLRTQRLAVHEDIDTPAALERLLKQEGSGATRTRLAALRGRVP
jgi:uncharacterized protein